MPAGSPSLFIRDGVQSAMTGLLSTRVSRIFWHQSASAASLTSKAATPFSSRHATVSATSVAIAVVASVKFAVITDC